LAAGVNVERFMREIMLAATLQHPCIVPLLSAGDMDGIPYYTMPLIEGPSLRQRLEEGRLSRSETMKVLRDIASALDAAHRRGVVHRDVKPENILLSGDYAMVTDFGIAKALVAAAEIGNSESEHRNQLTDHGLVLGTPMYMAPEQIAGDESVDHLRTSTHGASWPLYSPAKCRPRGAVAGPPDRAHGSGRACWPSECRTLLQRLHLS
jgi:serine/threonine-protein kinase